MATKKQIEKLQKLGLSKAEIVKMLKQEELANRPLTLEGIDSSVIKGKKGDKGEKGEKGDKGDRGEQGKTGKTGPQGRVGPKGPKGDKGPAGKDGKDGRDGKDGKNPDVNEVAVTAINFLETYEGEERLDAKAIKNLEPNIDVTKLSIDASQITNLPKSRMVKGGGSDGIDILEGGNTKKQAASKIDFGAGFDVTPTPNGVTITRDFIEKEVDYVDFDTTASYTSQEGRLGWNSEDGTLQVGMPGGNVSLQIGQESLVKVKATEDILNGQAVYISGASGNNPQATLAQADAFATSHGTIGIATEDITSGQQGYVTTQGLVRGINTDSFNEGDDVFLSADTAGALTNVEPTGNYIVHIGTVTRKSATEGIVLVNVDVVHPLSEIKSDLTEDTIPFVDANGFLESSSNLIFDGSKLDVGGNIEATSFIKDGATSDDILLGDGSTTSLAGVVTDPAGSDTEIQYNDNGSFGASSDIRTGLIYLNPATVPSGAGTRLLWYPGQAAFRAGTAIGTEWDDANIGLYSAAFGQGNEVASARGVAFGQNNVVEGTSAGAFGTGNTLNIGATNSFVFGSDQTVSSLSCFVSGSNNIINNTSRDSFVLGNSNDVAGSQRSFVYGTSNDLDSANSSIVLGRINNVDTGNSLVLGGYNNHYGGDYTQISGKLNINNERNEYSIILGNLNTLNSPAVATDEDVFKIALGNYALIDKRSGIGIGNYAHSHSMNMIAISNGSYDNSSGTNQSGIIFMGGTTSGATETQLGSNSSDFTTGFNTDFTPSVGFPEHSSDVWGGTYEIPLYKTVIMNVEIMAVTDEDFDIATWSYKLIIQNNGVTTDIVKIRDMNDGTTKAIDTFYTGNILDETLGDAQISFGLTSNEFVLKAKTTPSTRWSAKLDVQELEGVPQPDYS